VNVGEDIPIVLRYDTGPSEYNEVSDVDSTPDLAPLLLAGRFVGASSRILSGLSAFLSSAITGRPLKTLPLRSSAITHCQIR
jgi:hypothetical protein